MKNTKMRIILKDVYHPLSRGHLLPEFIELDRHYKLLGVILKFKEPSGLLREVWI